MTYAHLRRDDFYGFNSCRAEASDVKIPITFPFHDPPTQEKREQGGKRETRDEIWGPCWGTAPGEGIRGDAGRVFQSQNQSGPNLTPVFTWN